MEPKTALIDASLGNGEVPRKLVVHFEPNGGPKVNFSSRAPYHPRERKEWSDQSIFKTQA